MAKNVIDMFPNTAPVLRSGISSRTEIGTENGFSSRIRGFNLIQNFNDGGQPRAGEHLVPLTVVRRFTGYGHVVHVAFP